MTSLRIPSSKSMTQRALLISALATRPTRIHNALVCDDSRHLSAALRALGASVQWDGNDVSITPAHWQPPSAAISCGNAGTAVRFIACTSLLMAAPLTLDGDSYMRQRPIGPLADALAQLGVRSRYHQTPGCLPITLTRQSHGPARPPAAGPAATAGPAAAAEVDSSLSSQYLSGLLMVAPRLPRGLTLTIRGRAVSRPYVHMTVAMMRRAGAQVSVEGGCYAMKGDYYVVKGGGYPAVGDTFPTPVEADWSAAAFLLVGKRLIDSPAPIEGLGQPRHSLQGDAVIASWLEQFDATGDNRFDLSDHPDLIAPLAAMALFAKRPTLLTQVAHARVKECDRVAVLTRELGRLGARIDTTHDTMHITPLDLSAPPQRPDPITLNPEHDHRMAMTFGVVSLRCPHITVAQPDCVSKSFADFWQQLAKLRAG